MSFSKSVSISFDKLNLNKGIQNNPIIKRLRNRIDSQGLNILGKEYISM